MQCVLQCVITDKVVTYKISALLFKYLWENQLAPMPSNFLGKPLLSLIVQPIYYNSTVAK